MPNQRDFVRGRLLQVSRIDKGLSQKELAMLVDVTTQTIYNWEKGKSWTQIDNMSRLCEVIGIDIKNLSEIDKLCNCEDLESDRLNASLKDGSILNRVRTLMRTDDCKASSIQSLQENK